MRAIVEGMLDVKHVCDMVAGIWAKATIAAVLQYTGTHYYST